MKIILSTLTKISPLPSSHSQVSPPLILKFLLCPPLILKFLLLSFSSFSSALLSFSRRIQEAKNEAQGRRRKHDEAARTKQADREMSRKGKELSTQAEGKTKWDESILDVLVEICDEYVKSIKRVPGDPPPKFEWEGVAKKFNARTNFNFSKQTLKNRWDNLRKEWNLWKQMCHNETGLGWDSVKRRLVMDDEWWEAKIKEKAEYAKFRRHGFKYKDELELCYGGGYACGFFNVAPSSGINPLRQSTSDDVQQTNWFEDDDDDVYRPERPHTVSLEQMPEEISSSASSPIKNSSSEKRMGLHKESKKQKQKKPNVNDSDDSLSRLVTAVESQIAFNTQLKSPPSNSETKVAYDILNDIAREYKLSDALYFFGLDMLKVNNDRDAFLACLPEKRLTYLQHKFYVSISGPRGDDL